MSFCEYNLIINKKTPIKINVLNDFPDFEGKVSFIEESIGHSIKDLGKRIGKIQENFGLHDLSKIKGYKIIIPARNKIHGFDGLFLGHDNCLIIYESKFAKKSRYSTLTTSAKNTIENLKFVRSNEVQVAMASLQTVKEIGKITTYKPEGTSVSLSKTTEDHNFLKSLAALTKISPLLANEQTKKEEYQKLFKELFTSKNYALYSGNQIINKPHRTNQPLNNFELFEYSEEFDGRK